MVGGIIPLLTTKRHVATCRIPVTEKDCPVIGLI